MTKIKVQSNLFVVIYRSSRKRTIPQKADDPKWRNQTIFLAEADDSILWQDIFYSEKLLLVKEFGKEIPLTRILFERIVVELNIVGSFLSLYFCHWKQIISI